MSADAPHDALVALLRRLSQKQRLALARVSKAWQEAVVKSLTTVEAQIDISKSYVSAGAVWPLHSGICCWYCCQQLSSGSAASKPSTCIASCPLHAICMPVAVETMFANACVLIWCVFLWLSPCVLQSLATWLKHHGGMVETLSIGSCQPVSPEKRMYIFVEEDPVSEVDVTLPCASLQKLHTLRLYNARLSLEGVTDDTTHNPFPSLTSLKAYESPRVCPYLHMLTSLKQLSLSDMDFPDGNLHRMAIALTALTRLRLEWTGVCLWTAPSAGRWHSALQRCAVAA